MPYLFSLLILLGSLTCHAQQPQVPSHAYEVIRAKPKSRYKRLNLKPGDILVAINGQTIKGLEDAQRIYSEPEITELTVLRDGRELKLVPDKASH